MRFMLYAVAYIHTFTFILFGMNQHCCKKNTIDTSGHGNIAKPFIYFFGTN